MRLALRNGELWAVDVTWTPDGARRLRERTQRYISPAFAHDEHGRPIELINAALVAMPATHHAPALCARSDLMSPTEKKIAQILGTGSDPHALAAALKAVIGGLAARLEPVDDTPDAKPLSKAALAYCKRHGYSRDEFLARASTRTIRRGR